MNGSQLLYKISNLQHSIRRKEAEYNSAVKAGDQLNIDLNNAALTLLREDIAVSVKAFNSIPANSPLNNTNELKKIRWWQKRFFNLRTVFNGKQKL